MQLQRQQNKDATPSLALVTSFLRAPWFSVCMCSCKMIAQMHAMV